MTYGDMIDQVVNKYETFIYISNDLGKRQCIKKTLY